MKKEELQEIYNKKLERFNKVCDTLNVLCNTEHNVEEIDAFRMVRTHLLDEMKKLYTEMQQLSDKIINYDKTFICEICGKETPKNFEGAEPNTCAVCMPISDNDFHSQEE